MGFLIEITYSVMNNKILKAQLGVFMQICIQEEVLFSSVHINDISQ